MPQLIRTRLLWQHALQAMWWLVTHFSNVCLLSWGGGMDHLLNHTLRKNSIRQTQGSAWPVSEIMLWNNQTWWNLLFYDSIFDAWLITCMRWRIIPHVWTCCSALSHWLSKALGLCDVLAPRRHSASQPGPSSSASFSTPPHRCLSPASVGS